MMLKAVKILRGMKTLYKIYKPQIKIATGVTTMASATVVAAVQTHKHFDEVAKRNDQRMWETEMTGESKIKAKSLNGLAYVKLYSPVAALTLGGAALIFSGQHDLVRKAELLTAAVIGLQSELDEYRNQVKNELGEDKEKELYAKAKANTIGESWNGIDIHPASRLFDEYNPQFNEDPDINYHFIRSVESFLNNQLPIRKVIYLNEVYRMLGFDETEMGHNLGWYYDPDDPTGDNHIDFGIDAIPGEPAMLLDFNVDGDLSVIAKRVYKQLI